MTVRGSVSKNTSEGVNVSVSDESEIVRVSVSESE